MRASIFHLRPLRTYLIPVAFLLITLLLFHPLLNNLWYPTHDTTHIARLYLMEKTIAGGQFPPIWAEELNGGLGYPLFHFYAPLFYYLALAVKSVVGSYFIATKIILIASVWAGMMGMYLLVKSWFGRASAVVSAVSFATLPYLALNIFVRGAYAECLAMSLLPWLFYAWQDLSTRKRIVLASIVTSLFILSHNLIPLITLPFLSVWILSHHKKNLSGLMIPMLLTFLLSSFYLLPLIFERSFVQAETVAKTTSYTLHFVSPSQLWNSTWGFGGSAKGVEDGMSFKIGKLHLLLATSALLLLVYKKSKVKKGLIIFFAVAALLAAYMTTQYSQFIWEQISVLQVVQFPWRYLALIGFFIATLAGGSITIIKNQVLQIVATCVIIATLLVINLKLFLPQTTFPADLSRYTTSAYLDTLPQIVPEYLPRWMSRDAVITPSPQDRAYYPTWQVKIDGSSVATKPDARGLLSYDNPKNSLNIELIQSHTLLEKISYLLTIIGMIAVLIYAKK